MSQTDVTEKQGGGEGGKMTNLIFLFIYRTPKNNYEAMVALNNRVIETFKNYGVQRFEIFQLGTTEDMMEFINIAKTVFADQNEEEVWLEIQSYRDRKHLEQVGEKMKTDKSMEEESQQFLNLITPGSRCSFGEFSRLKDVGFV